MGFKKITISTTIIKKTIRIILRVVVGLMVFFLLMVILILTPPVQRFIKTRAEVYLNKKLQTKVSIGRIYIGLPKSVVLENIYLEDRAKDTLLFGGKIDVDISLLKLIRSEVEVNNIELDDITAKVKRTLPDTTFNFQFILDAFAGREPAKPKDTVETTPTKISLNKIALNKIRLVYNDAVTGNDVALWLYHFDIKIDKFDLDKMIFDIPHINLDGLSGKVYQTKPLVKVESAAVDMQDAREPSPFTIGLKNIDITKIDVDYRNDVSAFYTRLDLAKLAVGVKQIDLQKKIIALNDVSLQQTTVAIRLGKKEAAKEVAKQAEQELYAQNEAGWNVSVTNVSIDQDNIQFDNDNNPRQKYGMDYGHIKVDSLTLHVANLVYKDDEISGVVTKGNLREQSGFVLQQLQTDFLYASKEAHLKNLYIKTPGTELRRDAAIYYTSQEAMTKDLKNLQLDVHLQNSRIQVKDILTFVPDLRKQPAFANPSATWFLNGMVKGKLSKLSIPALQVKGLQQTAVDISGNLYGLPDAKKVYADVVIKKITTSKNDLALFLPLNTLPKNITLPDNMSLHGKFTGGRAAAKADLMLNTNLGSAKVKGMAINFADKNKAVYDVVVEANSLNIGKILQDTALGKFTLVASAKGKGYDLKTADAVAKGRLKSGEFNKYVYRDLNFDASIAKQVLKANASIHDPNIDITLAGEGSFAGKDPAVNFRVMIDSIKTFPLHLTSDSITYGGEIAGDFQRLNVDSLEGEASISKSLLVMGGKRVVMDSAVLNAGKSDSGQYIILKSDVANLQMQGRYKLTEVASVFQQTINPYFAIMADTVKKKLAPYRFTLNGNINNTPTLKAFVPDLADMHNITLQSRFADSAWRFDLTAPSIIYAADTIQNLMVKGGSADSAALINVAVQKLLIGQSIAMYGINLNSKLANNKLDANISIQDKTSKQKYNVGLLVSQPKQGDYVFSLKNDSLRLNYDKWNISDSNNIAFGGAGIRVKDFVLSNSKQELSIKSESDSMNSPLLVDFKNFRIATLTGFVQTDSLFADGVLNGNVKLNDLSGKLNFNSDLTISDLSIQKDTIGNMTIKVNNNEANALDADVAIIGKGNDVKLKGQYYLTPVNNNDFNFNLAINKLQLNTIEGATMGMIREASGSIGGRFAVSGTTSQPAIDGDLVFDKAAFNLTMLNSYFMIAQDTISIDKEGIYFDTFTIRDSTSNKFMLDGKALTTNLRNYNFDIKIRTHDFRALNTTKKDNKLYYGQLYLTTNLNVKGTEKLPVVDGSITVNDKTKLTVVLPQSEPGVVDRNGIVNFVDKDSPDNDSLFINEIDSLSTSSLLGFDINVNLNVKKEAEFSLVIDEGNGDLLKLKGEAALNAGIDKSGKITLTGSYELDAGSYELTFNTLHRKFDIQKGSRLEWTGEPTSAIVDISAIYTSRASSLDLVQDQLDPNMDPAKKNTFLQKLPYKVVLSMKGELMKPDITFDIQLPENQNYGVDKTIVTTVNTKLELLRQEPSELNKQVFALLLLNRFVQENPFESSGGGLSAEAMARQSVSKLLTDQLNQFASDLISFVDVSFDVQSMEDYSTGTSQQKTDLNVNVSKRLLNDRLVVTVGSNFQLEGPQAASQNASSMLGNVSVGYKLSKDGRYMVRVYQRNDYQGVLEGYVTETGVGFIITLDYDKFRDIFRKKKQREEIPNNNKKKQAGAAEADKKLTINKESD